MKLEADGDSGSGKNAGSETAASVSAVAGDVGRPARPESLVSTEGDDATTVPVAISTRVAKKVELSIPSSSSSSPSDQPGRESTLRQHHPPPRASNVFFMKNRSRSVELKDRLTQFKASMPDFRRSEILTSRPRNERHVLNEIVSILIQRRSELDEMNGIEAAIRYLVHKDNYNETAFNKRAQRIW